MSNNIFQCINCNIIFDFTYLNADVRNVRKDICRMCNSSANLISIPFYKQSTEIRKTVTNDIKYKIKENKDFEEKLIGGIIKNLSSVINSIVVESLRKNITEITAPKYDKLIKDLTFDIETIKILIANLDKRIDIMNKDTNKKIEESIIKARSLAHEDTTHFVSDTLDDIKENKEIYK